MSINQPITAPLALWRGVEQIETASKLINNILADSELVSNPPQRKAAKR